jgi:hypothetical protein
LNVIPIVPIADENLLSDTYRDPAGIIRWKCNGAVVPRAISKLFPMSIEESVRQEEARQAQDEAMWPRRAA